VIEIIEGDIAKLTVDAIVNAANSSLAGGGGVDYAVHRAAGPELAAAATVFAPCEAGNAVLTPGFRLPARFVIHAVGPRWRGGQHGEGETLRATYDRSFEIARSQKEIRSIAFPAISTGAYGFPKEPAAEIALSVMRQNEQYFDRIIACLFVDAENLAIYKRLSG
jgi:O-acetyl-ADP-ribose deacetylase (regulator of RNase III)